MRINSRDLKKYGAAPVAPAPPPIEPILPAAEEARLLARDKRADPALAPRWQRVVALLRRPAVPEGADAELVALLAWARVLPLDHAKDRIAARQRLLEIGKLEDPPPAVRELLERLKLQPGDSQAFADKLLPPGHDIGDFRESGAGFVGG